MYCEVTDRHFNVFFVEIELKKENLKSVFWAPESWRQNRYTGLQNGLNTPLPTKWSNNQTSVFVHFVGLALKGLIRLLISKTIRM